MVMLQCHTVFYCSVMLVLCDCYSNMRVFHYTDYADVMSQLRLCYRCHVFFMILSTGMHPVLFIVHLWEKGSSH